MKVIYSLFVTLLISLSAFSAALECKQVGSKTTMEFPANLHLNPATNSIRGPGASQKRPYSAFSIRTVSISPELKTIVGLVQNSSTCPANCEFYTLNIKKDNSAELLIAQEKMKPKEIGHYQCETVDIKELETPVKPAKNKKPSSN